MIGNVIQSLYLNQRDYPAAAALSFVLMAVIMVLVVIYIRFAGSEALMGEEATVMEASCSGLHDARAGAVAARARGQHRRRAGRRLPADPDRGHLRSSPSTTRPGRYNFTWVGFTLDHWGNAFGLPELNEALADQPQTGAARDRDLDRSSGR